MIYFFTHCMYNEILDRKYIEDQYPSIRVRPAIMSFYMWML